MRLPPALQQRDFRIFWSGAGILLALSGPTLCYGIDALSWFTMLAALFSIRSRPLLVGGRRTVSFEALRNGIGFVRSNPVILSMMVLDFGATLFGEPDALLPIFARDILAVGATRLGILFAATSVGSLTAATGMTLVPRGRRAATGPGRVGGRRGIRGCAVLGLHRRYRRAPRRAGHRARARRAPVLPERRAQDVDRLVSLLVERQPCRKGSWPRR